MGNPGMALMLGMGQALAAGIGGMDDKTMSNNEETSTVPEAPPEAPPDYGNSYPAGSFGIGSKESDYIPAGGSSYGVQRFTYGR